VTFWRCLTCDDHGSYIEPDTKTDTAPAAKHGHATVTTTSADWAARWV
jgi:hypothetical protein